jgi:hypothetical protein
MKMKKTLQTLRYLAKSYSSGIFYGFLVILGTVAVTDLVFYLTDQAYNTVHPVVSLTVPFEVTAGIFTLLIGMVLFIPDFKVALANGVSRKTFLLANLPAAGIAAAAFSIFNLVVMKVHGLFWPVNSISDLSYPQSGWVTFLLVQFTLYFLLIMVGRFISLAYYRSSTPARWAISLAPFVSIALLAVADARSDGRIFEAISQYLLWSLRFPRALLSMLAYSAILYGLVWLLLRRASLKD